MHNYNAEVLLSLPAGGLPGLHTLNISHNRLQSQEDIRELTECHNLAIVDLSYNQLQDPQIVQVLKERSIISMCRCHSLQNNNSTVGWLQIFGSMDNLRVLTLTGNPVLRKISYYRNVLIVQCVST
jgi:Leucine-rich repeat (LRR) protein